MRRDEFMVYSHVDVSVKLEPGRTPGWDFFGMQDELIGLVERQVPGSRVKEAKQSEFLV